MTLYSPHDQLPAPEPKEIEYPLGHFYNSTAKHLVIDTVRIMDNGLGIDLDKVSDLESTLVTQLEEVHKELANNPYIQKYLEQTYAKEIEAYIEDRKSKLRTAEHYFKSFKCNDINHRSYFMEEYAKTQGWSSPEEKLPTGVSKWSVALVKRYSKFNKLLQLFLKGELPPTTPVVEKAMMRLAQDKANMYNEKYLSQAKNPDIPYPTFNPASTKQKQELFDMLGIESSEVSKKTGLPSWDRKQIELINVATEDKHVKHFTQCFIDFSFAAIIKNNFIEAFYTYTVEDRLYGQYKLLGAKSGRYTSSNPNMLNAPSTGSRFAKAVKRCFTAPHGKIILTADYSALEDRVIASLSRDVNKCNIFLQNLDGHSLNALGYFPDAINEIMDITGDTVIDALQFKKLVDEGDIKAGELRQFGKGPTFGLAYGAFPPKIAKTLNISLSEATSIFDNYHNVLYPGITDYRENYVLPTCKSKGEIHLGLGFMLKTDDPDNDIRTLTNATCQFWSILTALTINKMHKLIDEMGYEEDIKVISTIYDSIYFEVTDDVKLIKWTNDNLINTLVVDFMQDQTIHNEAESQIGYNWADMLAIPNNASTDAIQAVVKTLREN